MFLHTYFLEEFTITSRLEQNLTEKGIVTEWLDKNFRVEITKIHYRRAIEYFLNAIYPNAYAVNNIDESLERYLSEHRNFIDDVKLYLQWLDATKKSPGTIHNYLSKIKKFFTRHGITVNEQEWDDLKTLMPSNVSLTQDNILTKEQLREVLKFLPIHGKAITLFLVSTGCRIGETLQLKVADVNFNTDPPEALLRARTTKKGVGQRFVFMTYEARDAIKDWLKVASTLKKPGRVDGKNYDLELVFDVSEVNFSLMWHRALKKAGLDKQDPETKYHIYHVHTLRKFFDTKMTLHGMSEPIVQGLMGHTGYLDKSYKRYPKEKLAEIYKEHMDAVTIYEHSSVDVKSFLEELEAKTKQIKELQENESFVYGLLEKYNIPNDRPLKDRLIELIIKLQIPPQPIPQPSKSELVTPIQVMQKPSILNEPKNSDIDIPIKPREILEQPIAKIELPPMTRACPLKGAYVPKRECDQCSKTNGFFAFSDCYNMQQRFKRGIPTDQDKALFDFAIVNGEYQIEK